MSLQWAIIKVIDGARQALKPLIDSLESPQAFGELLRNYGYESTISNVQQIEIVFSDVKEAYHNVEFILVEIEKLRKKQSSDLVEVSKVVKQLSTAVSDSYRTINQLKETDDFSHLPEPLNQREFWLDFPADLGDSLIYQYVESHNPFLFSFFSTLGIFSEEFMDSQRLMGTLRSPYMRRSVNWEKIPQIISRPQELLSTIYDYGNIFRSDLLIKVLSGLLNSLGFPGAQTRLSEEIITTYYANTTLASEQIQQMVAPLFWDVIEVGEMLSYTSLELIFAPIPPANSLADNPAGFVFFPLLNGVAGKKILIAEGLEVSLEGGFENIIPIRLEVRPGEIQVSVSNSSGTIIAATTKFQVIPKNPFSFFGTTESISIEVPKLILQLLARGPATQIEYIAEIISEVTLTFNTLEGDGFLQKIFLNKEIESTIDLQLGWSNKRGFYFGMNSELTTIIPVHISLPGTINISSVYLSIREAVQTKAIELIIAVTASLKLGPLAAQIEQMGLQAKLSFPPSGGNLGVAGFDLAFKPPTGLSLTLNAQGITGGGFLSFRPDLAEYKGGLVFEFQKLFTFRAIGIINTKLPGGEPGFSLFIMITGQFPPVQLSFGFTLSGLGGLFGYNRTIDTDVLNQMVLSGRAANLLFPPADTDLNQIVNDAGQAFPVKAGNFVFGPMARIGWGTPTIITAEIGLAIEVPDPVRVAMLGVIRVTLPEPDAPVARLNMVFLGVLDFSRKLFTLQATLFDSQLLSFALTGDFAMYISWGQQPLFIFSAGGFHPAYKEAPPQLNALRRLSLTLIDTQELKIGVQTYLALTSNTVQIGARAQVWGKTAIAEFNGLLWFDVLFQLDPFQFQAEAQLIAGVKIFGQDIAAVHLTAVLAGPGPWHFRGHGYVEIARLKKEVRCELAWGIQAPNLAPPSVDVWEMLKQEVAKKENWQSTPLPDSSLSGVSVKDLSQEEGIVLLPNVQLTFKQKLVPFGVELQKFGNAIPQQRYFEIQSVRLGKVSLATQEMIRVDELFAPASFLQLSDAEKLSRPSFENMQGGVAIRAASASGEVRGTPTECPVEYELKYIRAKEIIPQKAAVPLSPTEMLQEARAGSSFRSPLSREQTRPSYAAVASVMPRQEGFVLVQGRELSPFSENGQPLLFTSQTEAYQKRQKLGREDLLVMSTLEMEN